MNTTVSNPGIFQVTTDHPVTEGLSTVHSTESVHVDIGGNRIRIEESQPVSVGSPHFPAGMRADQLQGFLNWLQEQRDESASAIVVSRAVPEPKESDEDAGLELSMSPILRVDSAVGNPLNRGVPRPNFDTANYVEPSMPVTERRDRVPADSGSVTNDLQEIIRRLKADGRVMGDIVQAPVEADAGIQIPVFTWPQVTTGLLGSPSMMNLENNVHRMLTPNSRLVSAIGIDRGVGTTTVAISLARQIAWHGNSVLLVDADFESPDLANRMGLVPGNSWTEFGNDPFTLARRVITQKASPISVLPLATTGPRLAASKIRTQLEGVARWASRVFDAVLIDFGPLANFQASINSPVSGTATSLVVTNRVPGDSGIKAACRTLRSLGASELIQVDNFSRLQSAATA